MRRIRRRAGICVFVLLLFLFGLGILLNRYRKDSRYWYLQSYNKHLYSDGNELLSGSVCDRNGVRLTYVFNGVRHYNDSEAVRKATLHVVGDSSGKIGTSALATLRNYLIPYSPLSGTSSLNEEGNTVTLTINSKINEVAYRSLGDKHGTVCVYNYKTGEIVCLVSTPTFDPLNEPDDLETNPAYSGVYLNRFFSTTAAPGSVFKPVILQAALETLTPSDFGNSEAVSLEDMTFSCNGGIKFRDGQVRCTKAHGTESLLDTLANSCNSVYSDFAVRLGDSVVNRYIQSSGLTSSYKVGFVNTAKGSFEISGIYDYQLGYAGVGLYHDLVNPCSLLVYYGAIANGGTGVTPNTILSITDQNGKYVYKPTVETHPNMIRQDTAEFLREALLHDVVRTYGADRFPVPIGAKSGTVETVSGDSNSWFAGFVADDTMPYAFLVYVEHGGSGSRTAGTIAADVLKELCK